MSFLRGGGFNPTSELDALKDKIQKRDKEIQEATTQAQKILAAFDAGPYETRRRKAEKALTVAETKRTLAAREAEEARIKLQQAEIAKKDARERLSQPLMNKLNALTDSQNKAYARYRQIEQQTRTRMDAMRPEEPQRIAYGRSDNLYRRSSDARPSAPPLLDMMPYR